MVEDLNTQLCILLFEIQDERPSVLGRQDLGQNSDGFRFIRCGTSSLP